MIVTFCGHADFLKTEKYEQIMLNLLEKVVGDRPAEMYLGGYGGFDDFAYDCCKKYKQTHPGISLVFITPYLTEAYQKDHLQNQEKRFDYILYPEIENRLPKYAIVYRNKYMVEKADVVIAYVLHDFGGAYATYTYAKRKGKEIFNLAQRQI